MREWVGLLVVDRVEYGLRTGFCTDCCHSVLEVEIDMLD